MGFYKNIGASCNVTMTRTIHPVGQGAFYSEIFNIEQCELFSAVYDCGSRNFDSLEKEIINYKKNHKHIDVLFVSHFHCDHINGIPLLLQDIQKCNIYIPFISPDNFLIDILYNLIIEGTESKSNFFLLDIIQPILSDNKEPSNEVMAISGNIYMVKDEKKVVASINPIWEYTVYQPRITTKRNDALKKLLSLYITDAGFIDDIIKKHINKTQYTEICEKLNNPESFENFKNNFTKIFKGAPNDYSMMVYSSKRKETVAYYQNQGKYANCLYTGDTPVSKRVIKIISLLDYNMIQVPHHGSSRNFSPQIYQRNACAFISAGASNQYGHPDHETYNKISNMVGETYLITENGSSPGLQYIISLNAFIAANSIDIIKDN